MKRTRPAPQFGQTPRRLRQAAAWLAVTLPATALADHVPPVGLDYKGTWIILIAVGIIFSLLLLSLLWAFLDGQFRDSESVKYTLVEPEHEWPYGRGTSLERPEPQDDTPAPGEDPSPPRRDAHSPAESSRA